MKISSRTVDMSDSTAKPSKCWATRPTVEPIVFALFFVTNLIASPTVDLAIRQACRDYGIPDQANCTKNVDISRKAQRISSNIIFLRTFMETFPGCVISLFTGPWSSAKGRKPLLTTSLIGIAISLAAWAYLSTIEDIQPYYLLLGSIPAALAGGQILVIITSFCYMIDITTFEQRTLGLAVIMSIMSVTPIAANWVTPKIASYGYPFLYGLSAVIVLVVYLYSVFLLPESVKRQKDVKIKLITFDHLMDTFRTFGMRRPNNVRGRIIALTVLGCASIFLLSGWKLCSIFYLPTIGEPDVKYQSVIEVYHWDLQDYSTYNTVYSAIGFVGTVLGVYVGANLFHIDELILALGMMALYAIGAFLMGLAPPPASYAVVSQLQCFRGCISPIARGTVSKMIPHHEVSSVISFMTSLEAFAPQLGGLLYTTIYNATIASYPFTFYFFSCFVAILGIICILVIFVLQGGIRQPKMQDVNDTPKVEEGTDGVSEQFEHSDETKF